MHNTCIAHGRNTKTRYIGLILILQFGKGLTFYQTRSNAIILQGTLPAYCIPKVVRLKTGEVLYEKGYISPRPPPKISLKHEWTKELGSKVDRQPQGEVTQQPEGEVAQQPRGEVSRQAKFFQPTQPIPKPICDRSGQPDNKHEVFSDNGETSWSREIKEKPSHEELCSSDRSGQPDITHSVIRAQTNLSGEIRVEQTHDRSGQPDRHEFALRAARWSTSWDYDAQHRQWVNSWENWGGHGLQKSQDYHILLWSNCRVPAFDNWFRRSRTTPNRHALQRDLQQSQSFNPSVKNKNKWFMKLWNIELCELLDTEPKNAVQSMFIILGHRHRLLHVRTLLCEKEQRRIRMSFNTQWISFLFLTTI